MFRIAGAVLASLVLFAAPLSAQQAGVKLNGFQADPSAPVEVNSDNLELTQAEGTAVFSGNVIVTKGEMKLNAAKIVVKYLRTPDGQIAEDVDTITASGGVVMVTPTEAAEAETAVYTPAKDEVVMTGDVLLTQGPNTLSGTRLVVDLLTGTGQVEGRVRTLLQTGGTRP